MKFLTRPAMSTKVVQQHTIFTMAVLVVITGKLHKTFLRVSSFIKSVNITAKSQISFVI